MKHEFNQYHCYTGKWTTYFTVLVDWKCAACGQIHTQPDGQKAPEKDGCTGKKPMVKVLLPPRGYEEKKDYPSKKGNKDVKKR